MAIAVQLPSGLSQSCNGEEAVYLHDRKVDMRTRMRLAPFNKGAGSLLRSDREKEKKTKIRKE